MVVDLMMLGPDGVGPDGGGPDGGGPDDVAT